MAEDIDIDIIVPATIIPFNTNIQLKYVSVRSSESYGYPSIIM